MIIYPYITYEKTNQTNEQKNQIKSSPCPSKIWRPIEEGKISQVVLAKPTVVLRALSLSISPGHNRPSSRPGSAPQLPAKPRPSYFIPPGFNEGTSRMTSLILTTLKPSTVTNILQMRKRKGLD